MTLALIPRLILFLLGCLAVSEVLHKSVWKNSENGRRKARRLVGLSIIGAIVLEQTFLNFYLTPMVQRDSLTQGEFLAKWKAKFNGSKLTPKYMCERQRVAWIYSYDLCIQRIGDTPSKEVRFVFSGIKPGAKISLIPESYEDRGFWDSFNISTLDVTGNIVIAPTQSLPEN